MPANTARSTAPIPWFHSSTTAATNPAKGTTTATRLTVRSARVISSRAGILALGSHIYGVPQRSAGKPSGWRVRLTVEPSGYLRWCDEAIEEDPPRLPRGETNRESGIRGPLVVRDHD